MSAPLTALLEIWNTVNESANLDEVIAATPVGDVDGDGADDLLIVADVHFTIDRTAFVYFGSDTGPAPIAGWTATFDHVDEGYLSAAASAGDVNGDGFDDVIFGAPTSSFDTVGHAFVVLGASDGPGTVPVWSVTGPSEDSWFGQAVASAGDVNGDGFDDVLVGAYLDSATLYKAGSASLYLGSPSGPSLVPDWTTAGVRLFDKLGKVVASAGDVNGDGFDDVAIGASCESTGNASGRVEVFLGSASGLSLTPDWTASSDVSSTVSCTGFGDAVASAGDVNGDGFDDLIVGAPYESRPGQLASLEGTASLFLGSPSGLTTTPAWWRMEDHEFSQFGSSVASAGDIDGDGFDDVVIGASTSDDGFPDEGSVVVYPGGPDGLAEVAVWKAAGGQENALLGTAVAGVGDTNNDGFDDVIAFASAYEELDFTTGQVRLYAGTGMCLSGADGDGDGIVDACDVCVGEDASHDDDDDDWCALSLDGSVLDCDDANPDIYPGATEVCDGVDNDCFAYLPTDELDLDGDGVFPCGGDCDDRDAAIGPYVDELCGDGIDNNCDGAVDEQCAGDYDTKGCGCAVASPPMWWLAPWLIALTVRRRRATAT